MFDARDTLLPPTATPLAKALDILEERLFQLPVEMVSKNPRTVDVRLLDHLAWEESVDVWDFDWPEEVKRNVIAASAEVHRHKGTPYALKLALAAFDVDSELLEWFEPEGVTDGLEAGSFRVTAYAGRSLYGDSENTLNNRMVAAMNAVLQRAAPVSRKLIFRLGEKFQTETYVRAHAQGSQSLEDGSDPAPRPEPASPDVSVRTGFRLTQSKVGGLDLLPPSTPAPTDLSARTQLRIYLQHPGHESPDVRPAMTSTAFTLRFAAMATALSSEFHDIQRRA